MLIPFTATKALDEEDVDYFEDLEKAKSRAMQVREMQEQMALESFRAARSNLTAAAAMEEHGHIGNTSSISGAAVGNNGSGSGSSSGVGFVIPTKKDDSVGTFAAKPVIIGKSSMMI